ncbi:Threonine-phosphate decarboxylase [Sterolibacterium denitrificans]|uniref:threonine-phosphate decarboxylase n=1 Tax=Sterolibacterium denitrificans TaxID=157592 RepID=A0A7Z7HNS0_9PROT|nr:threonine-phosphate decarboxylase CobD [Sterolibacterium denitrificans]SMB21063.1 Threonine-phosphate decarboxylase [Sterolibacterium denitrificans]
MLEHGGRLRAAALRYGIAAEDWLDLSAGINPHPWPGLQSLQIPTSAWSRLPEDEDGLIGAACAAYGAAHALPVAGTQAAIQALPRLRAPGRVAIETPGYAEHAQAWQRAGHQCLNWQSECADEALLDTLDVLVLMQPSNPGGVRNDPQRLLAWHERLAAHGGWLVVDEAYVDATPGDSLAACSQRPGLIILRSLGKFFGLPGARVGFVLAARGLLDELADDLGPWPLAGPSRWLATSALRDMDWQADQRRHLTEQGRRLAKLLTEYGLPPAGGCALFQWSITPQAERLYRQLAQRGILVRLFRSEPGPASLRFGLPGAESGWQRLTTALKEISSCKP